MCQKIQPAAANKSRERQARSFAYLCGSGERDSRLARRLLGEGSRRGCRPHALPTTRPFLAPRPLAVHLWSRRSCQHVSRWSPPRFGPLPSPRGPASGPGTRTAALRREIHRRHIRSPQGPSSLPRGPRSRPSPPSSEASADAHPSWHLAFLVCSRQTDFLPENLGCHTSRAEGELRQDHLARARGRPGARRGSGMAP